jgi:hypothetical protein
MRCDETFPTDLIELSLAALHCARLFDPRPPGVDAYDARAVTAERVQQWNGRIRVWAHRYPGQFTKTRIGRRTLVSLGELQAFAFRMLDGGSTAL